MDGRKISYGEKEPRHPIIVMNNKKYINSNNPKAWLYKIMGYTPVDPFLKMMRLIKLAEKDGR